MVTGILYFFTACVILFGALFLQRFNKLNIIYFCSVINCFLTVFLLADLFQGLRFLLLFLLIIFVSLGMLTTLSVFGSLTVSEERGRIGGLIGFIVFILFYLLNYFLVINFNFFNSFLVILFINAIPLIGLLLKSFKITVGSIGKRQDNYYEKRVFILYYIPWLLFSLLNAILAKNTSTIIQQQTSPSLYFVLLTVQILGIVFGVLIGGLISDLLGRRLSLVFSLTLYGFGAALIGFFNIDFVFIGVYAASGLSWGILFVLYTFVVWGDLSNQKNRLQVYSIGLISYFLSLGIGSFIVTSLPLSQSALFSVMIIFVLNMPIIFAPELLSSYVLDKIRMKQHMGAVKKLQKKD